MNTKLCPTCKTSIPANAPGGFCPGCILRDADELPPIGRTAPSLDEVRAAFPQLEVLELIGQGGMGFVYKARQPSLDRTVALKILSPELGRDPAFAERFAREARVLGKLNHPNIVTVFEHGESGGFFYLIMEHVDGVNLRQAMRAGRFTPAQALAVVPGICDALQAAHAQGVWHRDIKPENILLDAQGGVKIVDFGIARIVGDPQRDFTLTMTGAALGSAAYMAPEQHESPHSVDHRADIYSLGVVIYEMLTGELPLGRFKAPSTKAAVDARIDEIVFRTLEKERELRQQSANEVKTDVQGAASGGGARPSSATSGGPKSGTTLALASKAAIIGGIVLFVAAAVFTYGSTQGVLLTLATTAFVLGGVGLLFGVKRVPSASNPDGAAPVTIRSIAMFLGGMVALFVGAWIYNGGVASSVVGSINEIAIDMGVRVDHGGTARFVGSLLIGLGAISAIVGWGSLWYALSLMKRGAIPTTLRGFARTCAWLPVAFLVFTLVMFPVRTADNERAVQEARARAEEVRKGAENERKLAEARIQNANLKARFPNYSTPQGAVVAYHNALDRKDPAIVLSIISAERLAIAAAPDAYAQELIAANTASKMFAEDTMMLINASLDAVSEDSAKATVLLEKRIVGKNSSVLKTSEKCVKEGKEWRVIPHSAPLKTAANPKPAVPAESPEQVLRKLNALANESNGPEFMKLNVRSRQTSNNPAARWMEPLYGTPELVKVIATEAAAKSLLFSSPAKTVLLAGLRKKDGSTQYLTFTFALEDNAWRLDADGYPTYRAATRFEFCAENGDPLAILRTHIDRSVKVEPVPGAPGQFDLSVEENTASSAANRSRSYTSDLHESLKKAGLDAGFKVIKKAEVPTKPIQAEEPVEKEHAKAADVELKGRAEGSVVADGEFTGATVHVGGHPLFVVVGKGGNSSSQTRNIGGNFEGRASFVGCTVQFKAIDGNRAEINQRTYDLQKGRTFYVETDGVIRQVERHYERVLEAGDLKALVQRIKTQLSPTKTVIAIRANGDLQFDGMPVAFDALGEQLKKLFPDPSNGAVSLAFEKDTKFENVSRVMDLVERAGIMIVALDRQAPAANAPLQATPMRIHFLPGNRLEVDGKAATADELISRLKQPNDGKTKWRFEVETEAGVEGRFIADVLQKMQAAGAKFDEDVMAKLRDSMKAATYSILGQVNKPGQMVFPDEPITVSKAITLAGGPTRGAALDKVQLRRTDAAGTAKTITVDVKKALEGKATKEEDPVLESGDVIAVPES